MFDGLQSISKLALFVCTLAGPAYVTGSEKGALIEQNLVLN